MALLPSFANIIPNLLVQVLPLAIAGILALVRARNAQAPTLVRSAGILLLILAVLLLAAFVAQSVLFMNMAAYDTTDVFRNIAFVALAREGVTLLLVVALVLLLIAIAFAKQPKNPTGAAQPGYGPPAGYGAHQPGYGPFPGPQDHGYHGTAAPGQHGRSSWDINSDAGGGHGSGGRDRG